LPYIIDPSCGSGTFLIHAMKHITNAVKSNDYAKIKKTQKIKERLNGWFLEEAPNFWPREFIFGIESDPDLALATKVNMVLHGDGNINIFNRDGLKKFSEYKRISNTGELEATKLSYSFIDKESKFQEYELNEQFDVVISNPPFSIKVNEQEQKERSGRFLYNSKKSTENLFIERWYQLLVPKVD
jgi:type I restriction enzyme M protein